MRILLLEDEIDLGRALKTALERQHYLVDWLQDGTEALGLLLSPELDYGMAILDWLVPGLSGLEVCQRLRSQQRHLPVLMLTARDRQADKVAGLDAGADDYLVKPFGLEELLARVRALWRRSPTWQPAQLRVGPLHLNYGSASLEVQINRLEQISLTPKQFQLMEYFLRHPRQVLPTEQLRDRLWGIESDASSNVVAAQIKLLRRRLEEYGLSALIETIPGFGYRLNPDVLSPGFS
jgi:DNA-binding response OmpR family regulator